MNRRTALVALTAPLAAPLVEWDVFGAFDSDGHIVQGIRRSGVMTFDMNFAPASLGPITHGVLYLDDGQDHEEGDASNIIAHFDVVGQDEHGLQLKLHK